MVRLTRRLREQLDDTLDAEQQAATSAALRRRSLRERLLEAEDRAELALAWCADGQLYRGTVLTVGSDHVVLDDAGTERFISLPQVVALEFR